MKVVAFNGSPRKGGNTEILIKRTLAIIEEAGIETEFIQIGGKQLRGCGACGRCAELLNGTCALPDDGVNGYIQKIIDADAVIMGSPSYFSGITPELKALIDRAGFVAYVNKGLFSRKIGSSIAAHRRGGGVCVTDQINHMYLMSRMIVPGSTYWNFGVGLEKGDVNEDAEAMANMDDLGNTITWLIKSLKNA
jgi:multimeric flavodoxin WrbA